MKVRDREAKAYGDGEMDVEKAQLSNVSVEVTIW